MTAATVVVRERPILFSGPMVRAILDGRKSQTRRVVKPQPEFGAMPCAYVSSGFAAAEENGGCSCRPLGPNYGQPGDRLYVKEVWAEYEWLMCSNNGVGVATTSRALYRADEDSGLYTDARWRSPILMPRRYSRITLELTEVRVERVQDISEADAIAEGFERHGMFRVESETARAQFRETWEALNAKRSYGWTVNPWVWVLSFRRVPS